MAYSTTVIASRDDAFARHSDNSTKTEQRSWLRRFFDAIITTRQRQADREIARFLESRGSRLTDEAEREIEERFLRRPGGQW